MNKKQAEIHKAAYQLESFLSDCKIEDVQGKTILELGFKNGHFLDKCSSKGMKPSGLEVEKQYYDRVSAERGQAGLYLYDGREFPVEECSFDYVVSFQVLEHVSSVEDVIGESIRVLKPGGIMYHVCPNYRSFYEGHCKCIWWPFLNRNLGRVYLKLIGKYHEIYEHLRIIKPGTIKKILRLHKEKIEIVSLGRKEFSRQFNASQVDKVAQPILKRILKVMLRFPVLARVPMSIIAWTGCYYPIVIIARKKGEPA